MAYIDGQPINSYNIDGNTAVVVEQLDKYGFEIYWDGGSRELQVSRDTSKYVSGGNFTSSGANVKVGTAIMDVYYTDIRTYLNGCLCDSYNVGGQTIVYLDDLNTIYGGGYNWNGSDKTLSLTLDDEVHYAELPSRSSAVQPLIPTPAPVDTAPVRTTPVETQPVPAPAPAKPESNTRYGLHSVSESEAAYVCNINSMKFHYPYCDSVNRMKESKKLFVDNKRDDIVAAGFEPCQNCHP